MKFFTSAASIALLAWPLAAQAQSTSEDKLAEYRDWSLGLDATWRNLVVNLSYVDTDISRREATYLRPSFSKGQDGTGNIAGRTALVSVTASF